MIQIFALNHTEASKILLQLPNYCPEYAAQLNVYQSLVEGILMEMLRLPRPQEKIVYYSTLLMDLCKGALDKVPSAMGRALKVVFERMDAPAGGMDVECIRRLSEWFSHHLSNFGYGWKWKDWVPAVIDSKTSAKYAFVRETVGQCVRLSYYDRIKSILPTEYVVSGVLPNVEPGFDFKYVTSTSTGGVCPCIVLALCL